jgi:hypothetical protein
MEVLGPETVRRRMAEAGDALRALPA